MNLAHCLGQTYLWGQESPKMTPVLALMWAEVRYFQSLI